VDEQAFQDAYRATNPLACPFEKAILIWRNALCANMCTMAAKMIATRWLFI